ncbi:methylmalonyl-CoA mutase C-terminal domain-containing protein/methyltransferase cognate corrinoid proteins [Clostridium collagenovorans DSM 3089]|uniref:Methylmalonyl-CoA mutase C-terminal domain-containing protein/methyltransferase cognate corrinoid proteins n=1 Tax=Clostridium collagenovorans DSM 3089 TaxID=1121306 RepID=A0A1M5UB89_9CLOT|nr:corrinoid protein [Clostridium collagenovorans]SHH60264.1 methylmalonyl-CoA mutase C-terminal domain-containing protein/methyltransferase cognate corrinoid proteins [Clostridium collagenovorans DSM 3089]
MDKLREKLLEELAASVVDMEEEVTLEKSKEFVENGFDAYEGIADGLAKGMDKAGVLYEEEEYYIPELLMCSDAMYAGLDILRPHLKKEEGGTKYKAVVGVVEGDTHDIGKNLFKIMLETCGFDVCDLGRDVPPSEFVKKARELDANLVGMSTLMTTTMDNMQTVIELLKEEGIREQVVVMVGGAPISQSFANKIGADGYAAEASKAARLAKDLVRGVLNESVNEAV